MIKVYNTDQINVTLLGASRLSQAFLIASALTGCVSLSSSPIIYRGGGVLLVKVGGCCWCGWRGVVGEGGGCCWCGWRGVVGEGGGVVRVEGCCW